MRPTPVQLRVLWMASLAAMPCGAVAHIILWFWEWERESIYLPATTYMTLAMCYMAVVLTIIQILAFRRPLRDPNSPWGIFARRKPGKLWELMLVIALIAPIHPLLARFQSERERIRAAQTLKWDQTEALIKRVFRNGEFEPLEEAARLEALAAESLAKDARGEAWESVTWAERSKMYAEDAVLLRKGAAHRAELRRQSEEYRAQLELGSSKDEGR
ncbi:MAG: hypothetical protein P4L85_08550 [Paludisphaera borealis]|uniref:hypothetical protein n=1 Tax=Paludisphaera borealis TaxID=1387353 RepID=UPI00283B1893|nr:hypothetical protein [Paludisphaera borealis]MDR3619385.1 hypothetical protein [Paludisphaera borealis]